MAECVTLRKQLQESSKLEIDLAQQKIHTAEALEKLQEALAETNSLKGRLGDLEDAEIKLAAANDKQLSIQHELQTQLANKSTAHQVGLTSSGFGQNS